jgi:hypothetical protein
LKEDDRQHHGEDEGHVGQNDACVLAELRGAGAHQHRGPRGDLRPCVTSWSADHAVEKEERPQSAEHGREAHQSFIHASRGRAESERDPLRQGRLLENQLVVQHGPGDDVVAPHLGDHPRFARIVGAPEGMIEDAGQGEPDEENPEQGPEPAWQHGVESYGKAVKIG